MGSIKGCYSNGVDGFVAGKKDASFKNIMVCNCEYCVVSFRGWEFSDEINSNGLKQEVAYGGNGE